jgi:hypothetical protein
VGIVSELSKVHNIGGSMFKDIGKLAVDYAKVTGTDVPTAIKALGSAFEDPVNGARTLDKALGTLSSEQLLEIQRLMRVNDLVGAQTILLKALKDAIEGTAKNAYTPLQTALDKLGTSWDNLMKSMHESSALLTAAEYAAKLVDSVRYLIENKDLIASLPFFFAGPAGIPSAAAPFAAKGIKSLYEAAKEKPIEFNPNRISSGLVGGVDDVTRLTQLVMGQESGGRRYDKYGNLLTSKKGAKGEMQVMDATALNPGFGVAPVRDNSADERARVGRELIPALIKEFGGDVPKALAAYNAGAGRVKQAELRASARPGADWMTFLPNETQDYVKAIMSKFAPPSHGDVARADRRSELSKAADRDEIKRTMDATGAYSTEVAAIGRLIQERQGLIKSIEKQAELDKEIEKTTGVPGPSATTNELQDRLVGLDEQINKKRQEAANLLQQDSVQKAQENLEEERKALSFHDTYVQGLYDRGEVSAKTFWDQKIETIRRGTAAEIAALEVDRLATKKHLDETTGLTPTDFQSQEHDRMRLAQIEREQARIVVDGQRKEVEALEKRKAAFADLSDSALNYLANLREMASDEEGAARLRAEVTLRQGRILVGQVGSGLTQEDLAKQEHLLNLEASLTGVRAKSADIHGRLQVEEDRIALKTSSFAVGEIQAMTELGQARQKALAELEPVALKLEEMAADVKNKDNWKLQLEASQFRLEIDKLKEELDPLAKKLQGLFVDSFGGTFADLMSGKFKAADTAALNSKLTSIEQDFNSKLSRITRLPTDGTGLSGAARDAAIKKIYADRDAAEAAAKSKSGGIMAQLKAAGASVSDKITGEIFSMVGKEFAVKLFGKDGIFGGLFKSLIPDVAKTATVDAAATATATQLTLLNTTGISPANLALTQFTGSVTAAALAAQAFASASGGGTALNLFGLGGLGGIGAGGNGVGTALPGLSGAIDGVPYLFADGGFTGNLDKKKIAGVVHGKEFVFSALATKNIGVSTLERMHEQAKAGKKAIPGYEEGGFVAANESTYIRNTEKRYPLSSKPWDGSDSRRSAKGGHSTVIQVNVTPPPGSSRATAMQWGATAGRQMQHAMRRNG